MVYRILADVVVSIHLFWILFLFVGAFWGVQHKVIKIFHLLGLAFALLIQMLDGYCPLTHLEVWLRSKHDPSLTYAGSFIIHYVEKIVYLEISRDWILVFSILLCGVNAWIYLRKRNPPSPSKK